MRSRTTIFVALLTAGLFGALVACGGGGGGSGLNESVNYTGATQPAVIDTTSAVQLALNATVGTRDSDQYGGGATPMALSGGAVEGGLGMVRDPGRVIGMVRDRINQDQAPAGKVLFLDVSAEPLKVECQSMVMDTDSDGGSMSLRMCADPAEYYSSTRYWISFAVIFDDYDSGASYQDGELEVQGTFDETIGTEGDFDGDVTLIFRDLVTIDGDTGEDSYIDGWVVYSEGTGTVTITYNMVVIDTSGEKAYWMDDYVIHIDHVADEVTLSGRFYDAEAGYVDLTTESVLTWDVDMSGEGELVWNSDHPTAGTVRLTGSNGYWISISFSPTGYTVQVNFTGDEESDATIGEISWVS